LTFPRPRFAVALSHHCAASIFEFNPHIMPTRLSVLGLLAIASGCTTSTVAQPVMVGARCRISSTVSVPSDTIVTRMRLRLVALGAHPTTSDDDSVIVRAGPWSPGNVPGDATDAPAHTVLVLASIVPRAAQASRFTIEVQSSPSRALGAGDRASAQMTVDYIASSLASQSTNGRFACNEQQSTRPKLSPSALKAQSSTNRR
jgi:hypothetical protein